jgi:hypothetical protein
MRHKAVQHHLNGADVLKMFENRGKMAVILAVCPGCSLMKKIILNVFMYSDQHLTI